MVTNQQIFLATYKESGNAFRNLEAPLRGTHKIPKVYMAIFPLNSSVSEETDQVTNIMRIKNLDAGHIALLQATRLQYNGAYEIYLLIGNYL